MTSGSGGTKRREEGKMGEDREVGEGKKEGGGRSEVQEQGWCRVGVSCTPFRAPLLLRMRSSGHQTASSSALGEGQHREATWGGGVSCSTSEHPH
eukprot:3097091-Rhodomonas_salina.1